jgi:hypothetical protein
MILSTKIKKNAYTLTLQDATKDSIDHLESPPKKYATIFTFFSQISTSDLNNTIIFPMQTQTQGERSRVKHIPTSLKHNSS